MSVFKKYICFISMILVFLLVASALRAQVVKGKIVDEQSGKPLAGANIYFDGTYRGTASDNAGNFTLTAGNTNIPLVVSYVGYESQMINNYVGKDLSISLKIKPNTLREVTIGADFLDRRSEMEIFLREFIGLDHDNCTISNPDDLYFSYFKKAGVLIAGADNPLIIYNKELGYKITYFLSDFRYSPQRMFYQGNYFFTEDTIGRKPKEIKKILKARNSAYIGSRMHFIRSLLRNSLVDEDFSIYDKDNYWPRYDEIVKTHGNQTYIKLKGQLTIIHSGNTTILESGKETKEFVIDYNGYFDPKIGSWSGYMSQQRVNQLLPFEFVP